MIIMFSYSKTLLHLILLAMLLIGAAPGQADPGQADPATQAMHSLMAISNATTCCFTRRGFIKVYDAAVDKVELFLQSGQAEKYPAFTAALRGVWRHYGNVAFIFAQHPGGLICEPTLMAQLQRQYPDAAKSFDQGGAVMQGPDGQRCLSSQLLAPIIIRSADRELPAVRKSWAQYHAGSQ